MYRVVWRQTALDELAAAWIEADSSLRQAISAASNLVDQRLSSKPLSEGESRPGESRVTFFPPLTIRFKVFVEQRVVRIEHARVFRMRKK